VHAERSTWHTLNRRRPTVRSRTCLLAVLLLTTLGPPAEGQTIDLPGLSDRAMAPDPDMPRPIAAHHSVFIEELTWLEVRDALRAGKTTAIVATGGVEQNGPYLATGKHNYVLRVVTERIAHGLGNALVAPIVPFVPQGNIDPPDEHMHYPGTISVRKETFKDLLKDIANGLRVHGFEHIILIGDSGGNQEGMKEVAAELSAAWSDGASAIHYIPEYYDNARVAGWLRSQGVQEVDEGWHDNIQYTAQMMVLDPTLVRMQQRVESGRFSINGVDLAPAERTVSLGHRLADYQAAVTVEAIRKALSR
jgi:creatinine amidohydrolase